MKKVLLSCVALAAGSAMAMAQALPEYPDHLAFTMNGEKELPGVTVTQEMIPYGGDDYLTVKITGEYDGNEITLDMVTPEGWNGMLTFSEYGESEDIEPLKAKAPIIDDEDHWIPLMYASWMGLTEGNTLTFKVDGKEHQAMAALIYGDNYYAVNIDFVFEVNKAGGSDVDVPTLPSKLEYTLNGEKELPGITVKQQIDESLHLFNVTGECNSDKITVSFATPEGWDGLMIADFFGYGEISTVGTRSGADLIPIESILGMGFKEGNTITFDTDGEANPGYIALVKGDMVCSTFIDLEVTVSKAGGTEEPGELMFPDHYNVVTFNEGITVEQGVDKWGDFGIVVEGEVAEDTFSIVIDVPEGWDGFYCGDWSEDDVVISENTQDPKRTRSEELLMVPFSELDDNYFGIKYYKGNRFTLKPTYNPEYNNRQTIEIHLYKGDLVTADYFNLDVCVSKKEGSGDTTLPEFPEKIDISLNTEGLTVTEELEEFYGQYQYDITIEGESDQKQLIVTFDVPEGWDGYYGLTDEGYTPDIEPLNTRSTDDPYSWMPLENLEAWYGYKPGNKLVFSVDGEEHAGYMVLYKGNMAYSGCTIYISTSVMPSETTGVESIDAASAARYYNLNGAEIEKPANGIFVKVVDGKASKVVVK